MAGDSGLEVTNSPGPMGLTGIYLVTSFLTPKCISFVFSSVRVQDLGLRILVRARVRDVFCGFKRFLKIF